MQKNISTLAITKLFHVATEPQEETRTYTAVDGDGNQVEQKFTDQLVRATWMCDQIIKDRPVVEELLFRPTQVQHLFPEAPTFGAFLKTYLRNEADLVSGKKLLSVQLFYAPRVFKKGDKAGVSVQSNPIIVGYQIVDADAEDTAYVQYLSMSADGVSELT